MIDEKGWEGGRCLLSAPAPLPYTSHLLGKCWARASAQVRDQPPSNREMIAFGCGCQPRDYKLKIEKR